MRSITISLLFLLAPSFTNADELRTREEIANTSRAQFVSGNYQALNRTGSEYLKNQSRTSSGLWKLTLFYSGLTSIPNQKVTDPQYWSDLKSKLLQWSALDPNVSFPHILYAEILIHEAWMYRGSGWGYQVRAEDWKPFYEKIEEARAYLEKFNRFKTVDPHWYETMLTIARAQGWAIDEFYKLFDESLVNHAQFYEIYFRAINYLQPKWHGSVEEIEKFATYATKKSEKYEGQGMYARIYWYVSQAEYGHRLFTASNARWEQMRVGINDVLQKYPDQWNINNFAAFSCLARDQNMTKRLISMIEGRPIISVWKDGNFYEHCKSWSASMDARPTQKSF